MLENFFYSAWAATICLLTVLGIGEERDKSRAAWWLPLDLISSVMALVGLLSFKIQMIQNLLGKALLPLCVLAAAEIAISAYYETKDIEPDEELTEEENRFLAFSGLVIVIVIFCGALTFGMIRGLDLWAPGLSS